VRRRLAFVAFSMVLVAAVLVVAVGAAPEAGRGLYRLMGVFGQVTALVRTSYVDEVPVSRLELGATTGLVEAADPGGAWVPTESAAAFERARTRPLPPFGLALGKRATYPFVVEVLPGSPAETAGIKAGQLIERIGTHPVRARPLWQAQVLLDQAESGKGEVDLSVIDARLEDERTVHLKRGPVSEPTPTVAMHDQVPVVRVPVLGDAVAKDLAAVLKTASGASAVVVDLRGTSLGSLSGAARAAAVLAGGDISLQPEGADGKTEPIVEEGPRRGWALYVCMDGTTARAGEALALALKQQGAVLVGGESYGDTGQRRPLAAEGGHVWLARQWLVSADGKPLLGSGLKPDEAVRSRTDTDAVLDRALELARGAAAKKAA
jgi:carboxyl-terminal processing protease